MIYSTDIILKLVFTLDIREIQLVEFPDVPRLQERFDMDEQMKTVLSKALAIRDLYKLPFWDAVLLTQFERSFFSKEIIYQAKHHNKLFKRKSFEAGNLSVGGGAFASSFTSNTGINSLVTLQDGTKAHLPLLDFHLPIQAQNLDCIAEIIRNLGMSGYILETNKSYHFYGKSLLSEEELINFLSMALLYAPVIDKNWIAHQLLERSCTLRISPKAGKTPTLVLEV